MASKKRTSRSSRNTSRRSGRSHGNVSGSGRATERLKNVVVQAARDVSEDAESASFGYVEVQASLARALSTALDALDRAERQG